MSDQPSLRDNLRRLVDVQQGLAYVYRHQPWTHRLVQGLWFALQALLAASSAYGLGLLLHTQQAFWAAITAIAVTQQTYLDTRSSSRDQLIGALVGGVVGFSATLLLGEQFSAYAVAIVVATDTGVREAENFSSDGNALSAAMDRDQIGIRDIGRSAGFYGAAERLQYSLQALNQITASEAPHQGRKILLWLSPGWPLLTGPNIELDSKQQDQIFGQIVSLSTQLRQARVTLYNVNPVGAGESVFRGTYYEEFLKGVSKPSQVNLANLGLQVLAIQSGGLALEFNNDVAAMLQQCVSDSAPYYEISFDAAAAERPDEYHHLEIRIDKPGLTARTRQGYYAQPAPRN